MRSKKDSLSSALMTSLRNRKKRQSDTDTTVARTFPIIASYNVHKCVGRDRKFDPDRTTRVIQEIGADIIALQEADSRFGERTGLLDLARLERDCGLLPVSISAGTKAHGWHGNVVLFKEGLVRDVHTMTLPGLEPRGALVVELELKRGGTLRIIAAHFGLLRHSRAQQVKVLVELMADKSDTPTILLGDLNEWRLGDRSSLHTFQSIFGPQPAAVPSFPARLPVLALDRIMSNRKGVVSAVRAHDTPLARVASDHLPIKAIVTLDQT